MERGIEFTTFRDAGNAQPLPPFGDGGVTTSFDLRAQMASIIPYVLASSGSM